MVWVNRVSVECHWSYQYWDFLKDNSILTPAVSVVSQFYALLCKRLFYDFGEIFASGNDLIQWNSVCLLDWHSNFPGKQILLNIDKSRPCRKKMFVEWSGVSLRVPLDKCFLHIYTFRVKLSSPVSLVLPRK